MDAMYALEVDGMQQRSDFTEAFIAQHCSEAAADPIDSIPFDVETGCDESGMQMLVGDSILDIDGAGVGASAGSGAGKCDAAPAKTVRFYKQDDTASAPFSRADVMHGLESCRAERMSAEEQETGQESGQERASTAAAPVLRPPARASVGEPLVALAFICTGRGRQLYGTLNVDTQALHSMCWSKCSQCDHSTEGLLSTLRCTCHNRRGVPLTGLFCDGEVGPVAAVGGGILPGCGYGRWEGAQVSGTSEKARIKAEAANAALQPGLQAYTTVFGLIHAASAGGPAAVAPVRPQAKASGSGGGTKKRRS
jgi:hypothetical protein